MEKLPFYVRANDAPAKQKILLAGLRLFARKGLSATSIRDIAEETGYTNPALYKHFPSKEALALYLFETCYQEQFIRLDVALRGVEDFDDALRKYLDVLAGFYDEAPEAAIFLSDNLASLWPQVHAEMKSRTVITLTRALIRKGRQQNKVSKDHPLDLQIALLTGTLGQITRQLFLGTMKGGAKKYAPALFNLTRHALR